MRVIITGASGFIGSHVTELFVKAGHKVLALAIPGDNLWRLQEILPDINVLFGNLHDIQNFQSKFCNWNPDACIHIAWYTESGRYLHSLKNLDCLDDSIKLLMALSKTSCKHFIGVGTCAEYEMKPDLLVENDKVKPGTLYAAAKLSFQMIGEQLAVQNRIHFAWGRVFYLYGDKENPERLVPSAIEKILNNEVFSSSPGEQIHDYLHVSDVANAFLTIMEKRVEGIVNVCSNKPIKLKDLLNQIGQLTGKPELLDIGKLPYREWEPMYVCGNNDRLKSFGWYPQVKLKEGLQEEITYCKHKKENL